MNTLLTIIIPFYGKADPADLQRCKSSLEQQGLPLDIYEVIVADDGGRGLGAARNNGMHQAKGDYLLFVDADDLLLPNSLRYCIDLLQIYHPDMLSFGFAKISSPTEAESITSEGNVEVYHSGAEYMVAHNFMGTAWRHFYRREMLEREHLRFAEKVYHEDEAFVAKAYFLAGTTVITDKLVYGYTQTVGSILNNTDWAQRQKRMDDFLGQLLELNNFKNSYGERSTELQTRALQRRISFLTIDFLRQLWRNHCSLSRASYYFKVLRQPKLFPLRGSNYSTKYILARAAINTLNFFV